jgi:predicted component of type VI protein secretion system
VEEFPFEELEVSNGCLADGQADRLCWINPAYLVGAITGAAFSRSGRGGVNALFEAGARIGGLPSFITRDIDGDPVVNGPVEVGLDRHQDAELRNLGFTPLQSARDGESVVINGFRSLRQSEGEG